jgi:hypothetical protein
MKFGQTTALPTVHDPKYFEIQPNGLIQEKMNSNDTSGVNGLPAMHHAQFDLNSGPEIVQGKIVVDQGRYILQLEYRLRALERFAAIEDEKDEKKKKYTPHRELSQHCLNKTLEIRNVLHTTIIRSRTLCESLRTSGGELKENLDSFQMPAHSWSRLRP